MRKTLILGIIILMILSLSSCSSREAQEPPTKAGDSQQQTVKAHPEQTQQLVLNSKTIDGQDIDNTIFKNYTLTMVNLWGTFCYPCISEMPDIQKLYAQMKDQNINVIGIIVDTPDENNEALARKIIKETGVKYPNIIPDKALTNGYLAGVDVVPTTIFVDNEGKIIGEPIEGTRTQKTYADEISKRLQQLQ